MSDSFKRCNGCATEKPISEFSPNSGKMDGLQGRCKKCFRIIAKDYRARHPEYAKKCQAVLKSGVISGRYILNPIKIKEQRKRRYAKYKEKYIANSKKWRKENLEKSRALNRKSYKKWSRTDRGRMVLKELRNRKRKRDTLELRDKYLKRLLRRGTILSSEDITPEMIEIKRLQLLLIRNTTRINEKHERSEGDALRGNPEASRQQNNTSKRECNHECNRQDSGDYKAGIGIRETCQQAGQCFVH